MGDFNTIMMRGILTLSTLLSVIFFPWSLTLLLAVVTALFEPLVPLAAGIFADTLYYSPHAGLVPFWTLCGAGATVLSLFVRSRLAPGIIGE